MDTEVAELIIRDVYSLAATRQGQWVSLTKIREQAGIDRATFDATVRRMGRQSGVTVVPEDDQKTLRRADRDAAVVIGGKAYHKIQM